MREVPYKRPRFRWDGFRLGPLTVTWLDRWNGSRGLEVSWGNWRRICTLGFKRGRAGYPR